MNFRLPPLPGEWIDRTKTIPFRFEGRSFEGYAGDTVTSALWAAGERVLGRSFKYHRPRGILSLANHDVNALLQWQERANLRSDVTPLVPGMELRAVNTWGGVQADRAALLDRLSRFLPVGFYYKAFLSKAAFPFWEKVIRQITGLGQLDLAAPRLITPKRYDFCDVLVIGAGPSGLSAALAAAEAGLAVVLVDENARAGGSGGLHLNDQAQTEALVQSALAHPRIRWLANTVAAGYYADFWVPLVGPEGMAKLRTRALIVASGAMEQPAVFRNNDLPGVMLASAAQRLLYRYAVRPARQVVIIAANSDGYRAALDMARNNVAVEALLDWREQATDPALLEAVRAAGIPLLSGHCLYEAIPGKGGVAGAIACPVDAQGQPRLDRRQTFRCDGVLMSVGWSGAGHLLYQAGTQMRFDDTLQQFVPAKLPAGIFAAGRVNGVFDFAQKLRDGERAGSEAAAFLGVAPPRQIEIVPPSASPSHPYPIVSHPRGKNFVDFDEDLQLKDFTNAIQEGFDNIELIKRFTTVGMGPSQGKHSNLNAIRILARTTGQHPGAVGTTTARPFFHPVPMADLAGRGFTPERRTALHDRHKALGAKFMPAGAWQRPAYYGPDREQAIQSEVKAVRKGVGIIDVSTLGKLEIRGPGAAEFLERIYTGRFANLKVGMSRYAVMLDEAGVVIDDGVVARLGSEHFYFTTTTSGAAAIYRELTRWNILWQLDCGLVNLTGARSAINLAGPRSRAVLAKLTDLDLADFPYLGVREGTVAGIPAVILRVGFVGEWGYEIHVPTSQASALWDALMQADAGIQPFGVEAQRLLRLEKGHLIVGQDTDGLTTPSEANLDWAVKRDKPFFIGQRSLAIPRPTRHRLVGFTLAAHFAGTPPEECCLVIAQGEIVGRVTSIAQSPTLGRWLGLATLPPEQASPGSRFTIRVQDGSTVEATVTATPFYDPDNLRQKEATPDAPGQKSFPAAPLPRRCGVRGPRAAAWLAELDFPLPPEPNTWLPLPDGGLIARLGDSEFFIEGTPLHTATPPPGVYPVLRQDAAFTLSGPDVDALLAQTCNIHFAALDPRSRPVVLTAMASVNVQLIPMEQGGERYYRLWCDSTYGTYLSETLQTVASETPGDGILIEAHGPVAHPTEAPI